MKRNSCGKNRWPDLSAAYQSSMIDALDAAHGFFFGDARVGDAIQVMFEELDFLRWREVAVVRHALVVIVRDKIVNVFLEVRAGAADPMNFVLANHLGKRKAELGRAHRARERDKHFAAARQDA